MPELLSNLCFGPAFVLDLLFFQRFAFAVMETALNGADLSLADAGLDSGSKLGSIMRGALVVDIQQSVYFPNNFLSVRALRKRSSVRV